MAPRCLLESHINRDRAWAHRYHTKHTLSLPRRGSKSLSKRYGASEAGALTVLESALSFRVPYCRTIITVFALLQGPKFFLFFWLLAVTWLTLSIHLLLISKRLKRLLILKYYLPELKFGFDPYTSCFRFFFLILINFCLFCNKSNFISTRGFIQHLIVSFSSFSGYDIENVKSTVFLRHVKERWQIKRKNIRD